MEGIMRNAILCSLTLCLILGAGSRGLAAQDDDEPVYEGRALSSWIRYLSDEDAAVRAGCHAFAAAE
jgi:hypothetical protein